MVRTRMVAPPTLGRQSEPQNAWLWDNPDFSDVKLFLATQAQNSQHTSSLSEVELEEVNEVEDVSIERPLKKACKISAGCRRCCVRRQQRESQDPAVATPGVDCPSDRSGSCVNAHIPPFTFSFDLHVVVLSSASSYFKQLFARGLDFSMVSWCQECKVLNLVLEGRELEAAQHVLRFIYTQELPTSDGLIPDGMLLMWMIKVADYWDVQACIEACRVALCLLSDTQFPTNAVFSLPTTFCTHAAVKSIRAEAGVCLLNMYRDALGVMRNPAKQEKWMQLPHPALLYLLMSCELQADSEATVLLLAKAWYDANRNTCSPHQFKKISQAVRFDQLTVVYTCRMLPQMLDFKMTLEESNDLRLRCIPIAKHDQLDPDDIGDCLCPSNWVDRNGAYKSRPWPTQSEPKKYVTVCLKIPEAGLLLYLSKLSELLKPADHQNSLGNESDFNDDSCYGLHEISSDPVYAFGYNWVLSLTSGSKKEMLSLGIRVYEPSFMKSGYTNVVARCVVRLVGQGPGRNDPGVWCKTVLMSDRSFQVHDFLGNAAQVLGGDFSLLPWAHHLVNGNLCFEADITEKLLV